VFAAALRLRVAVEFIGGVNGEDKIETWPSLGEA
jgi:hypothetical protein